MYLRFTPGHITMITLFNISLQTHGVLQSTTMIMISISIIMWMRIETVQLYHYHCRSSLVTQLPLQLHIYLQLMLRQLLIIIINLFVCTYCMYQTMYLIYYAHIEKICARNMHELICTYIFTYRITYPTFIY